MILAFGSIMKRLDSTTVGILNAPDRNAKRQTPNANLQGNAIHQMPALKVYHPPENHMLLYAVRRIILAVAQLEQNSTS